MDEQKSKKFLVTLQPKAQQILKELMEEDFADNVSGYFTLLIMYEKKRRQQEKDKRSPGRPRKESGAGDDGEECEDTEAIYPHPDDVFHKGVMLTKMELDAYNEFKSGNVPQY